MRSDHAPVSRRGTLSWLAGVNYGDLGTSVVRGNGSGQPGVASTDDKEINLFGRSLGQVRPSDVFPPIRAASRRIPDKKAQS
jgi:hypothetical protein